MKYTIIATGYNCEQYVSECIESIINQTVDSWELFVYDDGSTDNTYKIAKRYANNKIHIIRNEINEGGLKGRYHIINNLAKGDVICLIGLDDSLTLDALEVLDKYYTDDVLMTWGSWMDSAGNHNIATNYDDEVWRTKNFRRSSWKATSLNTFKRSLISKVDKKFLMRDGKWMTNCTDLAYSFPCLEMIEKHNARVITNHIYNYRTNNPNNTLKRFGKQNKTSNREYLKTL